MAAPIRVFSTIGSAASATASPVDDRPQPWVTATTSCPAARSASSALAPSRYPAEGISADHGADAKGVHTSHAS